MAAARPMLRDSIADAEISVRVPGDRDIAALIGLINALAVEAPLLFVTPVDSANGHADVRSYLATVAASDNQAVLVAERAGRLVGMATAAGGIHPAKRGVAEIGIGVLAVHRGRGVGHALMAAIEAWARGSRIHRLQRPVAAGNEAGITLYRGAGFEIEGVLRRSVMVEGRAIDQYMMAKLLA